MQSPSLENVEKVGFVLSLAALAYLYGFATHTFDWFPAGFLERAWLQTRVAAASADGAVPHFAHPRVYQREGPGIIEPDASQPGLTLAVSVRKPPDWAAGLELIDADGRTVHDWPIDAATIFSSETRRPRQKRKSTRGLARRGIVGSYLFPNGDVLVNINYVGTARLDACGRVVWKLAAGTHHSIARADDGSFWIPGGKYHVPPITPGHPDGLPGLDGPLHVERLLRVSASGQLLQSINLFDVLYANGLERHVLKGSHTPHPEEVKDGDITHLNDIEPLSASMADEYPFFAAGDLLVSLRNLDLVFVLDPKSRRMKWHATHPFVGQHDPDFVGDGWIGVFDNSRDGTERGTMLGGSRIVALHPSTDSARLIFPTGRSDPFYTPAVGRWQELENGNLLLTESLAGRIVEVAPDGRTVWEWVHPPYDEANTVEITGATRHDLTAEDVASWPCSPTDARENRKEADS